MKVIIFMAWLLALVDCLSGCASQKFFSDPQATEAVPALADAATPQKVFHQQLDITIPLTVSEKDASLNADVFRPNKMLKPKTLVIIVPGSGNTSRRGEVNTDGINTFDKYIDINYLWGKALADQGLFVLSYDKRTCNLKINPLCQTNWHKDIDEAGIKALATDLDQICSFAKDKLSGGRIVLLSSTQGAQVISLSSCLKDASAVVLLSPIVGDLGELWINGLNHAVSVAKPGEKNTLINRKESIEAFFKSLKRGDFPDSANIKGASLKFWQSWIESSPKTLPKLLESAKPGLLVFSSKDSFSPPALVNKIKNSTKNSRVRVSLVDDSDRNLAAALGVSEAALKEISRFIKDLR